MATPVVMPQMGESIAEGTIVRWIKKVGDSVDRDEPLFEISTDKVDAEIPSPAAGTLLDIAVKEGETVPVNSVVATIGAAGRSGRRADRREARHRLQTMRRAAAAGRDSARRRGRRLPHPLHRPTASAAPASRGRPAEPVERRSWRPRAAAARSPRRSFDELRRSTTSTSDGSRDRHRRARHQEGHPRLSR